MPSDEQAQGQATSETDSTPEATQEEAKVTVEVEEKPKGKSGFTQADLNKVAGKAREEARQAAINDLVKNLGLSSADDIKSIVEERKAAEEAQMAEAEKLQKALEKEQKRAGDLEATYQETLSKAQNVSLSSEAKLTALALDVKPERVNAVLKLADLSSVNVNPEDFSVDEAGVKSAIEAVLTEYPEFVATQEKRNIGATGSNPAAEIAGGTPSFADMGTEDFLAQVERVKMGERISPR